MVTRTIETTKVHALVVNVTEQKTLEADYILAGTYKDAKALAKALDKLSTDDLKIVHPISVEVIETLYGMSEADFIANATKLPPRGQKAE
jgi:hypothetical protein